MCEVLLVALRHALLYFLDPRLEILDEVDVRGTSTPLLRAGLFSSGLLGCFFCGSLCHCVGFGGVCGAFKSGSKL